MASWPVLSVTVFLPLLGALFIATMRAEDEAVRDVRAAAADAGVPLRVIDRLGQAPDHPVLLAVPETRYLTGLLLQAP